MGVVVVAWRKRARFAAWWAEFRVVEHYGVCDEELLRLGARDARDDGTWFCCVREHMNARASYARYVYVHGDRVARRSFLCSAIRPARRRYARLRRGRW